MGEASRKCGYLDVKLQSKHIWKRRWVIIQPLTNVPASCADGLNHTRPSVDHTEAMGKQRMAKLSIYQSQEAYEDGEADKSIFYLHCVTSIQRCHSRTHHYAFCIHEDGPVLHLAAGSETSSQEWMTSLRDIFWPIKQELWSGKDYHDISVIDTEDSITLGIFERYKVTTNPYKITLLHPTTGATAYEWKLYVLSKVRLLETTLEHDQDRIIAISAGPKTSSGSGLFKFYCRTAITLLSEINKNVEVAMVRHHEEHAEFVRTVTGSRRATEVEKSMEEIRVVQIKTKHTATLDVTTGGDTDAQEQNLERVQRKVSTTSCLSATDEDDDEGRITGPYSPLSVMFPGIEERHESAGVSCAGGVEYDEPPRRLSGGRREHRGESISSNTSKDSAVEKYTRMNSQEDGIFERNQNSNPDVDSHTRCGTGDSAYHTDCNDVKGDSRKTNNPEVISQSPEVTSRSPMLRIKSMFTKSPKNKRKSKMKSNRHTLPDDLDKLSLPPVRFRSRSESLSTGSSPSNGESMDTNRCNDSLVTENDISFNRSASNSSLSDSKSETDTRIQSGKKSPFLATLKKKSKSLKSLIHVQKTDITQVQEADNSGVPDIDNTTFGAVNVPPSIVVTEHVDQGGDLS